MNKCEICDCKLLCRYIETLKPISKDDAIQKNLRCNTIQNLVLNIIKENGDE